ncbi:NAD(P)/FAD-dependent oxidoreductase [Microvirga sp. Mcv34]|uniref:NAD(P)/FAD-dependent oxidoreductase n=1 Tax=Microvirga sp. Mcv34 TaxID=2926016 RepID=UPI0021C8F809|nr:NAD(P)/FAD-dependent oxidoreductase [Microvirga sp. Mcv34]
MTLSPATSPHIAIIGGGFTGLAAAYDLTKAGVKVTILEADASLGGLAGGFDVGGYVLERFYHHWFSNDQHVVNMVRELNLEEQVVLRPTRTGMYYTKNFFKLSSPIDVLRFTPLSLINRIRLGLVVPRARAVKNWMKLENVTAREWLIQTCGKEVFRIVWEPLLVGKFGPYADKVSAVWFWKKIALRGSSRSSDGREILAYYRGGFAALADSIGQKVREQGGDIRLNTCVTGIESRDGLVTAVKTESESIPVTGVLATPALPLIADLVQGHTPKPYTDKLRRVQYLANICLVLELDRSLSDTYWLNVADPNFPFVGVIEHTNFEPPESYGGRHIVYLSKYLPAEDLLYSMSDDEVLDFSLPHIKRMFPAFNRSWLKAHHVWRAEYAQPIMEKNYSQMMPAVETPLKNLFISTMAQVYPEDRGTNYAIREGRAAAKLFIERLASERL